MAIDKRQKKPKSRKPQNEVVGPFVNMAVFCQRPIEDKSGLVSAIKVFDQIEILRPPGFKQGDILGIKTWFLVIVKPGDGPKEQKLRLVLHNPSGATQAVAEADLIMLGGEAGSTLRDQLELPFDREGLYWLAVEIDGKTLTRVPLRVVLRSPPEHADHAQTGATNQVSSA